MDAKVDKAMMKAIAYFAWMGSAVFFILGIVDVFGLEKNWPYMIPLTILLFIGWWINDDVERQDRAELIEKTRKKESAETKDN